MRRIRRHPPSPWSGVLPAAFACAVATGVAGIGLLGCAADEPQALALARVAVHSDPLSLDPHLQNEMLTFAELSNVYESLTSFDAQLRIEPALAESWENPDERTWRFHLRHGARFHDGRPLRPEDVVFSLQRARHHPRSNLSSYLVEVAAVLAAGPATVELVTTRPFPILLNKLAYIGIVPEGSPEEITQPVGTGPYRFVSFTPGVELALERFAQHWRPATGPRSLRFLKLEQEERVRRLLAGEVELVRGVPPDLAARVESDAGCRLEGRLGLSVEYLHLRSDRPPFDDLRVRQAIDLALDREALVVEMLRGHGRPVGQMVSPNVFGYHPGLRPTLRDLARARALLAEAGYAAGLDLTLELRQGRDAGPIQAQLAEAGVRVRAVVSPWPELYRRLAKEEVPFYYGGVLAPSADASDLFDSFAHSADAQRGYGANNFIGYRNSDLDRLIERSGTTVDMLERRELLQQAMSLLMRDLVMLPLFVDKDLDAVRHDLVWEPRLDGLILGRSIRRR